MELKARACNLIGQSCLIELGKFWLRTIFFNLRKIQNQRKDRDVCLTPLECWHFQRDSALTQPRSTLPALLPLRPTLLITNCFFTLKGHTEVKTKPPIFWCTSGKARFMPPAPRQPSPQGPDGEGTLFGAGRVVSRCGLYAGLVARQH